jgi:hypothetical protein
VEAVSDLLFAGRLALAVFDRCRLDESPTTGEPASRLQAPVAGRGVFHSSLFFRHLESRAAGQTAWSSRPVNSCCWQIASFRIKNPGGAARPKPTHAQSPQLRRGQSLCFMQRPVCSTILITGSRRLQPAITARARCRAYFQPT